MSTLDTYIKSEYSRLEDMSIALEEENKQREAERAKRAKEEAEAKDSLEREVRERELERKAREEEEERQMQERAARRERREAQMREAERKAKQEMEALEAQEREAQRQAREKEAERRAREMALKYEARQEREWRRKAQEREEREKQLQLLLAKEEELEAAAKRKADERAAQKLAQEKAVEQMAKERETRRSSWARARWFPTVHIGTRSKDSQLDEREPQESGGDFRDHGLLDSQTFESLERNSSVRNVASFVSSPESVISQKEKELQDEIEAELAKLEALQNAFIVKVQQATVQKTNAPQRDGDAGSILKSDLFSKSIFSKPSLKSQESLDRDSDLKNELDRLRLEQSVLFAKGRQLTHAHYA